ncbi:MAG: BolA family transcriptional regulator [Legionellales bacterium]|nr:BolA family transcriptional regulator [Legionellales bacterium]
MVIVLTGDQIQTLNRDIEVRIRGQLNGAWVQVQSDDGHHFSAEVHWAGFKGLSLLEQHRVVYQAVGSDVGVALHALSLNTRVLEEAIDE